MADPTPLARFQDDFAAALAQGSPALDAWLAPGATGAGLAVYRNTVAKGAVDALVANVPAAARLTGAEWMQAAAAEYAREHPPRSPVLIAYGAGFADWLAEFPPARALPYLADVGRLDRMWMEAHLAADAEPLAPAALAALSPAALATTAAALHPSARFAWFDTNAPSLWRAQRQEGEPPPLAWEARPEGVLLVRPHGAVIDLEIGAGAHAFLAECRAGRPLAEAADAALAAEPGLDLAGLVALLLDSGAMTALTEDIG